MPYNVIRRQDFVALTNEALEGGLKRNGFHRDQQSQEPSLHTWISPVLCTRLIPAAPMALGGRTGRLPSPWLGIWYGADVSSLQVMQTGECFPVTG